MSFWLCMLLCSLLVVVYNYAGYAIIVYSINAAKKLVFKPQPVNNNFCPSVSFIVAAYNEADCIEQKISNSLALDYPAEQIEFIFITDGSIDATPAIVRRYPSLRLLHQPQRQGKSAALNTAVANARHDIIVFSDANTLLNSDAIRKLARHYADPQVGGVSGEKKVLTTAAGGNEVGEGEGLYWRYESFLKKTDAAFYSVVGAAGELFSLRRSLYQPVSHAVILDDFVISLQVAQKGYRVLYEPGAYAMELPSFSMEDEQKRKVRIAAGGFQAMWMLRSLLLFWKHPRLSFLYVSHRVLRWTLSPLCLLIALLSNIVLVCLSANYLYKILLIAQLCFYGAALAANYVSPAKRWSKLLKLPYYFVFMNSSVMLGFARFIRGKQAATWEKAKRSPMTLTAE